MKTPPMLDTSLLEATSGSSTVEPDFLGYTARSWIELVEEAGPVFTTELKGVKNYVICGHDADLAIWRSPDSWIYGPPSPGGEFFLEQMGELHVTQLDGDAHRRMRKLLLPAFGVAAVTRNLNEVATVIEDTMNQWPDQEIDLHPSVSRMIARCLSRHQVRVELTDDEIDQLVTFEEAFIPASSLTGEDRKRWYQRPEYQRARSFSFDLFRRIVLERIGAARVDGSFSRVDDSLLRVDDSLHRVDDSLLRVDDSSLRVDDSLPRVDDSSLRVDDSLPRVDDSLDLIIHKGLPEGFEGLSEDELVCGVYLLLVAGVGNIANILCAAFWALSREDIWREKLRAEVRDFSPVQLKEGMGSLPLMKAFISEVERCYLPAPVIPKMTAEAFDFMGYQIPGGVNVLQLHGLGHFDDSRYQDPFEFNPDRWLAGKVDRPNAFGGGTHLCLGMGVTRLYVPLILALALKSFDWQASKAPALVSQNPELAYAPSTTSFRLLMSQRCD